MRQRLSRVINGMLLLPLLLIPATSHAQATAGLRLVGRWTIVTTDPAYACADENQDAATKHQTVFIFTDSTVSRHCKDWGGKASNWEHGGATPWTVVQDTLVWYYPGEDMKPLSIKKCVIELEKERLTIVSCTSEKWRWFKVPTGVYERADSLKLE